MPAFSATAPGKIILFGEHAVVYSRPAIAVPVTQVRAKAMVTANPLGAPGEVRIAARDIQMDRLLSTLPADNPLALAITSVMEQLQIQALPSLTLQIASSIPIAAGLGSGAAVSVAIARALSGFLGHPLTTEQVSQVAYRVDQKHHGTPSGIDNTVIAYAKPIFFVRGQPYETLAVHEPFTIVIGNTGVHSPTAEAVGDVRKAWQTDPEKYERLFDEIAEVARQARTLIEHGPTAGLGPLMLRNQELLRQIDVSCPELDRLVNAALAAGAAGAKLCGGGRGGNMIALATPGTAPSIADALQKAGAINTITTTISPS